MKMIELESMAVEMPEVEGHPNRAGFRGVLTVVDVASQRAPSGSKGHRVVLTRAAADAALPSLLGMALDYAPTFDRHDVRRKVGVITSAEVVGRNLEIGGYLYAKDFPEIVKEIGKLGGQKADLLTRTSDLRPRTSDAGLRRTLGAAAERIHELVATIGRTWGNTPIPGRMRATEIPRGDEVKVPTLSHKTRQGWGTPGVGQPLGMSFEVADVTVADLRAHVWTLSRVTFTGAAILRRDKAAYEDTWIELVM
ncbi:MAG: hypothetical protein ACLQBK_15120 [Candidatus Sulfotelmatobacter sp.]